MLTKRIIPCLDVKDGRTVKGTKFVDLRDAGDPVELAARYSDEGADELVFLDISASQEGRKTFLSVVERVAKAILIPFTVGGGISTVDDVLYTLMHEGLSRLGRKDERLASLVRMCLGLGLPDEIDDFYVPRLRLGVQTALKRALPVSFCI